MLVLAALVLITLSFRSGDDGPLSGVQSAGATVLRPFAVGIERVAQPFRDGYGWVDSLLSARSDAARYEAEVRELRQRAIQSEFALQENEYLRRLLEYLDGPRFPEASTRSRPKWSAAPRARSRRRSSSLRAPTTAFGSTTPS